MHYKKTKLLQIARALNYDETFSKLKISILSLVRGERIKNHRINMQGTIYFDFSKKAFRSKDNFKIVKIA